MMALGIGYEKRYLQLEHLINSEHGLAYLLVTACVFLALHFLLKIGEILFDIFKKKNDHFSQMSDSMKTLESRLTVIERDLNTVLQFRRDFNNLFTAIKLIAGDRWSEIHKKLTESNLP